jgi:hypothetical protein
VKKVALFLTGALAGFSLCFAAVYLSGMLVEYLGWVLYKSEADQQRNFNIVMTLLAVAALFGGWLCVRRFGGSALAGR